MSKSVFVTFLVALAVAGCESEVMTPADDPELSVLRGNHDVSRTYEVTVTNLTSSQPLTPPLVATHGPRVRLFSIGRRASEGVMEIAENGNLTPLYEHLNENKHVSDVVIAAGDPPPLLQGKSITFEIDAAEGARFLSWMSMLICTNDGFVGRNRILLPRRMGQSRAVFARAYDAGTEINTEDFADIVPPCQIFGATSSDDMGTGMSDPSLSENGRIRRHRGIRGGNDLIPDLHDWSDPVAKVEIRRIG